MRKRLTVIVLLIEFLVYSLCQDLQCRPYAVRLSLGQFYVNSSSASFIEIWFNTEKLCSLSYVYVEKNGASISKFTCSSTQMPFNSTKTHSYRCIVDTLSFGDSFEYNAFGLANKTDMPIPFQDKYMKSRVPSQTETLKFLVMADWGYLEQKRGRYDPLDSAMDYVLKENQIDLVLLNGDYAYDFSSNDGRNYLEFMNMVSQIGMRWPIIVTTGNHEHKTALDSFIFQNSFQTFSMIQTNLTTINLGSIVILAFDPFHIVLENGTQDYLFSRFNQQINKIAEFKKPIITASHYPLACSGKSSHCSQQVILLKDFFQAMIDTNTIFYLGSHYHTYERLYPYTGNLNFDISKQSPYLKTPHSKFINSVVEGIAGNNVKIIQQYKQFQPFTAKSVYNQTGYGIMTITEDSHFYFQHYNSTNPSNPADSLSIDFSTLFKKSMSLRTQ